MTELRFTVPGEPLPWQRTNTWQGRKLTSAEQREYQKRVQWAAIAAMGSRAKWNTDARFALEITAHATPRQRFDLDNVAKQIGDAGNGVLWLDDRRIDELVIRRRIDRANPRVEVLVRVLEEVTT